MAKVGKRFPLLIYEYTLNRWYPATLTLSIILFILWWFLPSIQNKPESDWKDTVLLVTSGVSMLMTLFLFLMRKAAYVRPYGKYLRLVTPFLRLNISYKRIIQTRSTEMNSLFKSSKLSSMQRESMASLMAKTALVVELKDFPIPLPLLRFFLSPFFFKDKTPHFIFLVKDWMRLSTELESFRTGGDIIRKKDNISSILSAISRDQ